MDLGCRVGTFGGTDLDYRITVEGSKVGSQDASLRAEGSKFGVQGSGFRVQGVSLGVRAEGVWCGGFDI